MVDEDYTRSRDWNGQESYRAMQNVTEGGHVAPFKM
jgi:hypothetical protein